VASLSVVIPAHNAEQTLPDVLGALRAQDPAPVEVIVVDDGSTDNTAAVAAHHGARVVETDHVGYVGGARNAGWTEARGDVVVFLDADMVPAPGWAAGLVRALREFPGAIVGCGRTFSGRSAWGWVAHLQNSTPYLPSGSPRRVGFLPSGCLAVPRDAPLRWDESYGGEDGVFCAEALAAGIELVFDPRFSAHHESARESFGDLRRQQRRIAYALARCGPVQREGLHKRLLSRVPLHYFLLVRLPLIFRRLLHDGGLARRFVRLFPRLVVAEWTLGASALRYVLRRPPLRGHQRVRFR
jgi:glycosyltransferase involved in cell wall biosynthesis